jgi:hypothetical protein
MLAPRSSQLVLDPAKGYKQSFLRTFRLVADKHMGLCKQGRDITVMVNASGSSLQLLAGEECSLLQSYGDEERKLRVAWTPGDNQIKHSKSKLRASTKRLSYGTGDMNRNTLRADVIGQTCTR